LFGEGKPSRLDNSNLCVSVLHEQKVPERPRRAVVCVYRLIAMKEFVDRLLFSKGSEPNGLDALLANVHGTLMWYTSKSQKSLVIAPCVSIAFSGMNVVAVRSLPILCLAR
jgi:hypothetical protein